jgi:hypothetical protein
MLTKNVQLKHVATAVGHTVDDLLDVARNPGVWYKPSFKTRIGGKAREIDPPTTEGKRWLRRLGHFIATRLPVHPCAHGSVIGHCNFTAAANHLGDRPVVTRDVANCFPTVAPDRFCAELISLGFQHDVSIVLTNLLLYRGRLPQGSPASNAALNLFFYQTDERIRKAAAAFGGRYTRYCDDLVISVRDIADALKAAAILENAIEDLALVINSKKRAENGTQDLTSERHVNGVRVDSVFGTQLPSEREENLISLAKRYALSARSCNLDALLTLAGRRRRLEGLLNYAEQARLGPRAHVRRILQLGDRFVARSLERYGMSAGLINWWVKNQYLDNAAIIKGRIVRPLSA